MTATVQAASVRDSYRDHVRRVVDEAPPLTNEQRAQLRQLLNVPGGSK